MRNLFCLLTILTVSGGGVFAQSGRNKQPVDAVTAARPRPNVELPDIGASNRSPTVKPTPPPKVDDDTIRVDSVLIPIPVSVTDAMGNAVGNLQLGDFALRVNGQAEEVSEISRAATPVRLALLFDNSSSVSDARNFEIKAATKFFKRVLRPNVDQAALYSVATITQQTQKLTGDAKVLVQAIQNLPPAGGATALLDGIWNATGYLRDNAKNSRRVIVIVSDGVDTLSDTTFEEAERAALTTNCQIYVVKTTEFENYQKTGRRGGSANLQDLTADRRMRDLADQTGGAVYSPLDEKELDTAFTRIAAELSEQYVLSYYPTDTTRDGTFKAIDLQIKNSKNFVVRTRKGYYVPKSQT